MKTETMDILETFELIVDTREQRTSRAKRRFASFTAPHQHSVMSYGDYCANVTLPSGEKLYDASAAVTAMCVIERKMSLDELAGNLTRGRDRFRREFEKAQEAGATVYLLVEDGSWDKILKHEYRSKFTPEAFFASLTAWQARYDLRIIFCPHTITAKLIQEILYRDMKERLENGEIGNGRPKEV